MNDTKKKTDSKRPVKTVRSGAIGASVWLETGAEGVEYHAFTLSRSWQSKNSGKEGYSAKYFARNRADLLAAIELACDAVEELERGSEQAGTQLVAA